MLLTPTEMERLTIFMAAELARRRRARGLKLNHPEAVAYLSDELIEGARDGRGKGELQKETLMREAREQGGVELGTIGYGVGNWELYNGRREEARSTLRRVLMADGWAAFGFIAAEADYRRIIERAL